MDVTGGGYQGYPSQPGGYGGQPAPQGYPGYSGYPPAQGGYPPGGGYPPAYAPPNRLNKRLLIPALVLLVAGILAIVAVALPFYTESSTSNGSTSTINYDFQQVCITESNPSIDECVTWSSFQADVGSESGAEQQFFNITAETMSATGYMAISGGIVAILAGAMALVSALGVGVIARKLKLWIILGMVGSVIALAGVVVEPVGLQSAANTQPSSSNSGCSFQFIGSCNGTTSDPGAAWVLMLVGGILGIISVLLLFRARKKSGGASAAYYDPYANPSGGYAPTGGADPYAQAYGQQPAYGQPQGYAAPPSGYAAPPSYAAPPAAGYGGYPQQPQGYAAPGYGGQAAAGGYGQPQAYAPSQGYGGAAQGYGQSAAQPPICRYCGTANPVGAYVCGRCGQRLV